MFLDALHSFPDLTLLAARTDKYKKILDEIADGYTGVHPELYRMYAESFRKAVNGVLDSNKPGSPYFDMQQRLQANVSRFAAYKAYRVTQAIDRQRSDFDGVERSGEAYRTAAKAVINAYNRYQVAEYNTATARARTARQWFDFNDEERGASLFPNLKWLPSRSAHLREEHVAFYGLVLPKSDPFWLKNQPGNLWNCKCDWEETDDPVTRKAPDTNPHASGLDGNPAVTGEIFTDEASYFQKAGNSRKQTDYVEMKCENVDARLLPKRKEVAELKGKTTTCNVQGKEVEVKFISKGISEYAQSMIGNKEYFWLKNVLLENMPEYIKKAECVARKKSDASHNTRKSTVELKTKTDYFYYFKITLSGVLDAYIHLGRYRESGKMYLYTITKKLPENTEML